MRFREPPSSAAAVSRSDAKDRPARSRLGSKQLQPNGTSVLGLRRLCFRLVSSGVSPIRTPASRPFLVFYRLGEPIVRALQPPFARLTKRGASVECIPLIMLRVCVALALIATLVMTVIWLFSFIYSDEFRAVGFNRTIASFPHFVAFVLFLYTVSVLTSRVKRNVTTLVRISVLWAALAVIAIGADHTLPWTRTFMFVLTAAFAGRAYVRQNRISTV